MAAFDLDTKEIGLLLSLLQKKGEEEVQKLLNALPGVAIDAAHAAASEFQSAVADVAGLQKKLSSVPAAPEAAPAPAPEAQPAIDEQPTELMPVAQPEVPADPAQQ